MSVSRSLVQVGERGSSFFGAAIGSCYALRCRLLLGLWSKEPMFAVERSSEGSGEEIEQLLRFAGIQRERGMQDELVQGRHWLEEEGI